MQAVAPGWSLWGHRKGNDTKDQLTTTPSGCRVVGTTRVVLLRPIHASRRVCPVDNQPIVVVNRV